MDFLKRNNRSPRPLLNDSAAVSHKNNKTIGRTLIYADPVPLEADDGRMSNSIEHYV